jgi:hypothetical protein
MLNAWHTLGTPAPLQTRWDEAAAKMIALGAQPILPVGEPQLFRMLEWLKANEPKPKPVWSGPSPAQKLADEELQRALTLHDTLVKQILNELKVLGRVTVKVRAAALGMVIDDALMAKPVALHMATGDFYTVPETRAATARVSAAVYALQDRLSRIESIAKLEKLDIEHVAFALGARIGALEDRLLAAETELEQLKQQKGKAHARRQQ